MCLFYIGGTLLSLKKGRKKDRIPLKRLHKGQDSLKKGLTKDRIPYNVPPIFLSFSFNKAFFNRKMGGTF